MRAYGVWQSMPTSYQTRRLIPRYFWSGKVEIKFIFNISLTLVCLQRYVHGTRKQSRREYQAVFGLSEQCSRFCRAESRRKRGCPLLRDTVLHRGDLSWVDADGTVLRRPAVAITFGLAWGGHPERPS